MSALMKEEWEIDPRTAMPRPADVTERRGLRLLEPKPAAADDVGKVEERDNKLTLSVALFAYLYIP